MEIDMGAALVTSDRISCEMAFILLGTLLMYCDIGWWDERLPGGGRFRSSQWILSRYETCHSLLRFHIYSRVEQVH